MLSMLARGFWHLLRENRRIISRSPLSGGRREASCMREKLAESKEINHLFALAIENRLSRKTWPRLVVMATEKLQILA